jgi:DNA modification methylase
VIPHLSIIGGDALEKLRELPTESVQCCVTSPPYWGLRDYGTASWEGGDAACSHKDARQTRGNIPGTKQATNNNGEGGTFSGACPLCGAVRTDSQLGLEKTPEEYVGKMVKVFREVRRVLRKDGTVWLNLGDSLQDKQLQGIPWRVAFALQADGWYLRQDIIWNKANCMPESVTDRCTKSHEYIFMLTKAAKYYYDAESIKEPASESDWENRAGRGRLNADGTMFKDASLYAGKNNGKLKRSPNYKDKQRGHSRRHDGFNDRWDNMEKAEQCSGMRNKRDVWTVAPANYPEAHFATFPADLIKPCILAGSKADDIILDPFAGSGTTGEVALELGRSAVLIELNPKYTPLIEARCNVTLGLGL